MATQFTQMIKRKIRHDTVKRYLADLGITPEVNPMRNYSLLSRELYRRGFEDEITNENIRNFIASLPPEEEPEPTPQPEEEQEEEEPPPPPPSIPKESATMLSPPPPPSPSKRYVDSPEYKNREQKKSDDKLFANLSHENAELRAKNERLEREKRTMKTELAEQHREFREQLEAHEKAIMEMKSFTDTHSQLSSDERIRKRVGDMSSITDGHVTTNVNDEDYKRNPEMVRFIERHKPRRIDCDGFIPLFDVSDEHQDAFHEKITEVFRKNGNEPNKKKIDSHGDYFLYYINNLSSMEALFETLDVVYRKHEDSPFKIMCDSGFILEKHNEDECTFMYNPPTELVTGRSITTTITNEHDLEVYKHYIYSYITEKTEITHENSRNRYCAIVSFMFKVIPLIRTGKRTSNLQLAPEYEFLLHDNHFATIECEYNICVFNTFAPGLLLQKQPN